MRDHHRGAAVHAPCQGVLHQPLALRVQRAGRLQACKHASITHSWRLSGDDSKLLIFSILVLASMHGGHGIDHSSVRFCRGVTSSRSRMRGFLMRARAMATRCFCPPDSWMPPAPSWGFAGGASVSFPYCAMISHAAG